MDKIRVYVYREGRDFTLPEAYKRLYGHLEEEAGDQLLVGEGGLSPHPDFFLESGPLEAELFFFPYDLERMMDQSRPEGVARFLTSSLPYLRGRERRHIFSDSGDIAAPVPLPVCILKRSVLARKEERLPRLSGAYQAGPEAPVLIVTWYRLPEHVARDKPSFDWAALRYDASFVGGYTHIIRNIACKAAERTAGLRFYSGGEDKIVQRGAFYDYVPRTPEEKRAAEARFRRITKESMAVFCPSGVGPQSYRLYESMYYGRIPVLFLDKIRYPLEGLINYEDFCLFIAEEEIGRTGEVLLAFLRGHSAEELRARCVLACRCFNKYFRNEDRPRRMAALVAEYAAQICAMIG